MTRRLSRFPFAVLLLACLAALPACKKNKTDGGGGGGGGGDGGDPAPPGAAVTSDYVLFAHLRAQDILRSSVFAEVKQAFAKAGGTAEWDQIEQQVAKEIGGVKPTDVDSVTVCVTDVPPRGEPKVVLIMAANKAIDKAGVMGLGAGARPDGRGFYTGRGKALVHFPNDKTLVLLHPDLAQPYLNGYAKNRAGWPMTADLTAAAAGHTLFAVVQMQKVPTEMLGKAEAEQFGALLGARTVTLTADLKDKQLSVAARATFPDAAAAGRAKDTVNKFIGMAVGEIDKLMTGKESADLGGLMPAVKEAHRALKDAKVEVSGTDLTITGSYKADFDIGTIVAAAVLKVREAAARMTAQNNLRQVAIGLYNYSSLQGQVPVLGVGSNGALLKNATEKPLLSWRVALLPYIEQDNLYREFKLNEPWDSEHNKKLIEKMPKIYAPVNKPGKPGYTHLQMAVGPNAMQPPSAHFPGAFPDGMSNTIAVFEAAEPVIWTKPDDLMLPGKETPKDLKKRFGGLFPGGFNVVMWDGSVRFVRDTVTDRTLGLLLDPKDGQVIPFDW